MLSFLENGFTNDFGLQWNDTTCDWCGWIGYAVNNAFKTFNDDTLNGVLKQMVLWVKSPKWEEWVPEDQSISGGDLEPKSK
jgi:hypothetical protein